jgi:hypothetical protein
VAISSGSPFAIGAAVKNSRAAATDFAGLGDVDAELVVRAIGGPEGAWFLWAIARSAHGGFYRWSPKSTKNLLLKGFFLSGWSDLNTRPPGPKAACR